MSSPFDQSPEYHKKQIRGYSENFSLTKQELIKHLQSQMVLLAEDANKLDVKDQFDFKFLNGRIKKIESLGEKWATFQAINFNSASQPFYVQLNKDLELLNSPIQYSGKNEFRDWLKKGLKRSIDLSEKKDKNIYDHNLW